MTTRRNQPVVDTGVAEHVAERLTSLGRNPDAVTQDAIAALGECCHGSRRRLQTLLTAALFLASTDSAPAVTADHVRRAAAMQPEADAAEIGQGIATTAPRPPVPRPPVPRQPVSRQPVPALRTAVHERLVPPRAGKAAQARRAKHPLVQLAVASILAVGILGPHPIGPRESVTALAVSSTSGRPPSLEEVYIPPRPPVAAIPSIMPRVIIDCVIDGPTAWPRANNFAVTLHRAGIRALRIESVAPPVTLAVYYAFEADRVGAEYVSRLYTNGESALPIIRDDTQGLPPGTVRFVMQ